MLRNWSSCTLILEHIQQTGVLGRRNFGALSQYFSKLHRNELERTQIRRSNICKLTRTADITQHLSVLRLYSNDSKGNGRRTHKPPGTTKRVDECTPYKVTGPHNPRKHDECKPVLSTLRSRRDECGPGMMKQAPQPDCPYDDGKSYKKYIPHIIGGILLLLASVIGLYYLDKEKIKDEGQKTKKKAIRKTWRPRVIPKIPKNSSDIPKNVPYLLIGGGTASFAAFRAIKSADPTAKVLVVNSDGYYPHMRPPLSKELWFNESREATKNLQFKQWNGSERSLFYEPEDFYVDCTKLLDEPNGGVAVALGWTIKKLEVYEQKAILEDDSEISYEKCLIATGATPQNLPLFLESCDLKDRVTLYRGIYDFQELDDIINTGAKSIAIIGGGFLGSELACALARKSRKSDLKVYQIFREPGNMGKVLPGYLSDWTTNKVRSEGVKVLNNTEVEDVSVEKGSDQVTLSLNSGAKITADHIVVAVGVQPNTELAEPSDLEVDEEFGGYLVNAELMARTNLWVAGDCMCFYDVKLGRRHVEHHDHAVVSGRLAGENMTGAGKPYLHQSMFWSDLGPDVGYEAIGIVDASLPTVGVFCKGTEKDTPKAVVAATDEGNRAATEEVADPVPPAKTTPEALKPGEDYGKGIIFYLRDNLVVGLVMWNVFNRMSVARQVLKDNRKYDDLNEVAKLFNIHEE